MGISRLFCRFIGWVVRHRAKIPRKGSRQPHRNRLQDRGLRQDWGLQPDEVKSRGGEVQRRQCSDVVGRQVTPSPRRPSKCEASPRKGKGWPWWTVVLCSDAPAAAEEWTKDNTVCHLLGGRTSFPITTGFCRYFVTWQPVHIASILSFSRMQVCDIFFYQDFS